MAASSFDFDINDGFEAVMSAQGVNYHKTIVNKSRTDSDMHQGILLPFRAWATFCAVLPEITEAARVAKIAIDKKNNGDGEIDLPSSVWRLSDNIALFLSAREGSGPFKNRHFLSMSLRGCFEKAGAIYPLRGDGVNLALDDCEPLMKAHTLIYQKCMQEYAFHDHEENREQLCNLCEVMANGVLQHVNLTLSRDSLRDGTKGGAARQILAKLVPALKRYEKRDCPGPLFISIGVNGMAEPGLPVRKRAENEEQSTGAEKRPLDLSQTNERPAKRPASLPIIDARQVANTSKNMLNDEANLRFLEFAHEFDDDQGELPSLDPTDSSGKKWKIAFRDLAGNIVANRPQHLVGGYEAVEVPSDLELPYPPVQKPNGTLTLPRYVIDTAKDGDDKKNDDDKAGETSGPALVKIENLGDDDDGVESEDDTFSMFQRYLKAKKAQKLSKASA